MRGRAEQEAALHLNEDLWRRLADIHHLSDRQVEMLRALVRGFSDRQIAGVLGIQQATVRVHMARCFGKLNTQNRTTAILNVLEFTRTYCRSNGCPVMPAEQARSGGRGSQ